MDKLWLLGWYLVSIKKQHKFVFFDIEDGGNYQMNEHAYQTAQVAWSFCPNFDYLYETLSWGGFIMDMLMPSGHLFANSHHTLKF